MFDKMKFKSALALRGYSAARLSRELGVTTMTMSLKTTGKREFTREEIVNIQRILGLSKDERDDIFFGD